MGRIDLFASAALVCTLFLGASCRSIESLPVEESMAEPFRIAVSVGGDSLDDTKGLPGTTSSSLRTVGFGGQAWWTAGSEHFSGFDEGHEYAVGERFVYYRTVDDHQEWLSANQYAWPAGQGLSFFFWAPWLDPAGEMFTFPLARTGNLPRGRFTQASDPTQQVDFCLAEPVFDVTGRDGLVNANFHHALTRLQFYFNITGNLSAEESALLYRVKSLTLEGIAGSNTFTYADKGDGFTWDFLPRSETSARDASYSLSIAAGTLTGNACPYAWDVTSETGLDKFLHVNSPDSGTIYAIPQPMTYLAKIRLMVSGYSYSGGVWTEERPLKEKVILLPEQTVWKAGETLAYTASIDVSQWIEETD